jgi:tetratricopeptide (TPR) repeat protein
MKWPKHAGILASWGAVLRQLGRYEDAVAKLEEAVGIDEYVAGGLVEWANALGILRKPEALRVIERALKIEPRNSWALALRGTILDRMNRTDEAVDWYAKALERAPEGTTILLEWSNTLFRKGRVEEKEEKAKVYYAESYDKLRLARKSDPWNTAPLRAWGFQLLGIDQLKSESEKTGRAQEALEKFDLALQLDQYDWAAWAGRGDALLRLKSPAKASKAYRRSLSLRPNELGALTNLGRSLAEGGRDAEAILQFERALKINPGDSRLLELLEKSARRVESGKRSFSARR